VLAALGAVCQSKRDLQKDIAFTVLIASTRWGRSGAQSEELTLGSHSLAAQQLLDSSARADAASKPCRQPLAPDHTSRQLHSVFEGQVTKLPQCMYKIALSPS